MSLHTARGHLTEPPIAKCLNARQDWMEMQLHSTVVNGKSAACGDSIPALNTRFFLAVRVEAGPAAPTHSYSRMAFMASLENCPSLRWHCSMPFSSSSFARWPDSRAPVSECSLPWVLLMAPVHSSSMPAGSEQWMCNHICTRGASESLSTSTCLTNGSKFTIRNARHNLRHHSLIPHESRCSLGTALGPQTGKMRSGWYMNNKFWSGFMSTVSQCRSQAQAGHTEWHVLLQ